MPCGRVLDFNEVFAGPQIVKQQMAIDVEHPGRGAVRMLGLPVKLDRTPCAVRQPSPALGVHTAEVLAAAGYSAAEIGRLGPG